MAIFAHSSQPSSSTQCIPTTAHDGIHQLPLVDNLSLSSLSLDRDNDEGGGVGGGGGYQLSLLNVFGAVVRKSLFGWRNWCESEEFSSYSTSCLSSSGSDQSCSRMEIGIPGNVRHVTHVIFDKFNGFLGLPVEFESDVPSRAPSASATVFGVSTDSMQLSFDARGNSVPTILLLMQHRLYALGGLEVEGIFRINPGNGQEEYVRDQLNRGVVPNDADVHCLAGLIKAWFRELPIGLLDCLSPELLMQSQTEEECARLARLLPSTEAALLDWAINLMADVAQCEKLNKMNVRNIAVVFAPSMTHVLDPLTALMHAVQAMNFLKNLITRTLREREDSALNAALVSSKDPLDENDHYGCLDTIMEETNEESDEENQQDESTGTPLTSIENTMIPLDHSASSIPHIDYADGRNRLLIAANDEAKRRINRRNNELSKGTGVFGSINYRRERVEAWR